MKVLWVTNDLPPRAGGIQQFVANLLSRIHPADTVVIGPGDPAEHAQHDERLPYRVVRAGGAVVPTRRTRRLVMDEARRHGAQVIVLGAAWPLGELARHLRRELGIPVVALSHGLEAGLVHAGLGHLSARATRELTVVTTISRFTAVELDGAVRCPVRPISPGVDVDRFHPQVSGRRMRASWGIPDDALVVGCVSRLVSRKGQDALVRAWRRIGPADPRAWLVIVGDGPRREALRRQIAALGPDARVVLAGGVAWDDLPATYAALDLFAMPCRTRWRGIDVEGLGMVYLEAQACGVPVIVGDSGGAPETVREGVTGSVVDGRDVPAIAEVLTTWLGGARVRSEAGDRARQWALARWSWTSIAREFSALLDEVVAES